MKTLDQIKDDVAVDYGYEDYNDMEDSILFDGFDTEHMPAFDAIAKEYAQQACENLRERIAENAEVCFNNGIMENPIVAKSIICNDGVYSINKDSILKTEIILP